MHEILTLEFNQTLKCRFRTIRLIHKFKIWIFSMSAFLFSMFSSSISKILTPLALKFGRQSEKISLAFWEFRLPHGDRSCHIPDFPAGGHYGSLFGCFVEQGGGNFPQLNFPARTRQHTVVGPVSFVVRKTMKIMDLRRHDDNEDKNWKMFFSEWLPMVIKGCHLK